MIDPNFIILYVNNPATSAQFYAGLMGQPPAEISPTFAMFALSSGMSLGLWARSTVEPSAVAQAGGSELAFAVAHADVVDSLYAEWCNRQIAIGQTPSKMGFGYSFLALDPDGHRLRVFAPSAQ